MANTFVNNFEIPSWAGKPAPGLHLDVLKDDKMVQKLMIDEKKCYFFGRNKQLCDFCIDHQSTSRVHAALIWHKHLNRPFIVDLGSTHGTYIGTLRLEKRKPTPVPIDSELRFGASTRHYIIRERPQAKPLTMTDDKDMEELEGGFLGLPDTEPELDNLTEFNTAHNRRIAAIVDMLDVAPKRRHSRNVRFDDQEYVINPEDVDPSVGRFRNMVQTVVIPAKKAKMEGNNLGQAGGGSNKRAHQFPYAPSLYGEMQAAPHGETHDLIPSGLSVHNVALKFGLRAPNLAPDIDTEPQAAVTMVTAPVTMPVVAESELSLEPRKKKYAKEAWPGKKPAHSLLGS